MRWDWEEGGVRDGVRGIGREERAEVSCEVHGSAACENTVKLKRNSVVCNFIE